MNPFNPFLRAFFRSSLPSQCNPVQHHILLVPPTDVLLNFQDGDTNALYADLAGSDEFLASHVLRIPGGHSGLNSLPKSDREIRNRARQYTTLNGRILLIKDATVFGGKGFKRPVQAQLLSDSLYHPDILDAPGWLIYYISRPLTGILVPVTVPGVQPKVVTTPVPPDRKSFESTSSKNGNDKKDVKSFGGLLYQFPLIAKQMQPGLDKVLTELTSNLEHGPTGRSDPNTSSNPARLKRRNSALSSRSRAFSVGSDASTHTSLMAQQIEFIELHDEEKSLREILENAVNSAIDTFQSVDRHQLSLLFGATGLTGIAVEKFIERYVIEHVDTVLFPKISAFWREGDSDLDRRIRQARDIDIAQVEVPIENGRRGKHELSARLERGVYSFRKVTVATSPQEMLEALVETLMVITSSNPPPATTECPRPIFLEKSEYCHPEKTQGDILTVSADILISLLLIVVIRSNVKQLQARFVYMRYFIFIDEVQGGEAGYALSTFEAVLSYLKNDSNRLIHSSHRNRRLWEAVKKNDIVAVQALLKLRPFEEDSSLESSSSEDELANELANCLTERSVNTAAFHKASLRPGASEQRISTSSILQNGGHGRKSESSVPDVATLMELQEEHPGLGINRTKKRVTMQTRTMSTSSLHSQTSRANTTDYSDSDEVGYDDNSVEILLQTDNTIGESLLMMAIENRRLEIFKYLLSLSRYYTPDFILNDFTIASTTLMSAALQSGDKQITELLVDHLLKTVPDEDQLRQYFAIADSKGRSVGHYLFHHPGLIRRLGHLISWTQKDNLGQTPLLALCRSYDHTEYRYMMDEAIKAAAAAQGDNLPLHLDNHVDNKGNTLLHVVTDSQLASKLLRQCDVDVNSPNQKHFTPLMMVSKYGRSDLVRTLFGDPRVNVFAKDTRGFTAIDLAKDDDVRTRIDDLILLSSPPGDQGRTTAVVRSFLTEDGSIRLILKSAMPTGNSSWTVTTAPRALSDFEHLARCLSNEHPASWIPELGPFTSPFLIPSKPSRAVLRDIQIRLDRFLGSLLTHPTFSTHEMVWEFFLVPEMSSVQFEERSRRKAEAREEMIREEFTPLTQATSVELFVNHAQETVQSLHQPSRVAFKEVNALRAAHNNFYESVLEVSPLLFGLGFLPQSHLSGWEKHVSAYNPGDWSPLTSLHYNLDATIGNMSGILSALKRPGKLIAEMASAKRAEERHLASARRSERWPNLGILDGVKLQKEALDKAEHARKQQEILGKELSYTQQVIASDLAGWQDQRLKLVRRLVRDLVLKTLSVEKARLESLVRAARQAGVKVSDGPGWERGAGSSASSIQSIQPYQERRPGDPV